MIEFPLTVSPGDTITDEEGDVVFQWRIEHTYRDIGGLTLLMMRLARAKELDRVVARTIHKESVA